MKMIKQFIQDYIFEICCVVGLLAIMYCVENQTISKVSQSELNWFFIITTF